jgi:hypothetical protein
MREQTVRELAKTKLALLKMIVHVQIPRAGGREEKTEHPTWKLSLVRLWRWRVSDSAMPPEDYIRWTGLVEAGVRVSSNTTVLITARVYLCGGSKSI